MAFDPALTEDWEAARLIPVAGLQREPEKETRAASALLAVVRGVPDFSRALLKHLGAPAGNVRAFTEVRLKDSAGKYQTPDGVILVERGRTRWSCAVEFKTGRTRLRSEQVERYLNAVRQNGLDGLLTISNEFSPDAEWLPYDVDGRKLRGLAVRHLSWWAVLTDAILQQRKGIEDKDQAYILGELIRYLTDERSGAAAFDDMGDSWKPIREAAGRGAIRANDEGAREVARRWEQFVRYLCLTLSQELGVEVSPQLPRGKDADKRADTAAVLLAKDGLLRAAFRVPDAVGPVEVEANLASSQVAASVEIDADPNRQRAAARVRALLRQLEDAPDDLLIEARFVNVAARTSRTLGECRDEEKLLLLADDPRRDPRSFRLTQSRNIGRRDGRNGSRFVAQARDLATGFYRDLVQDLEAPRPRAPRLEREEPEPEPPENGPLRPPSRDARRRTVA